MIYPQDKAEILGFDRHTHSRDDGTETLQPESQKMRVEFHRTQGDVHGLQSKP